MHSSSDCSEVVFYLSLSQYELSPALPLRTLVPLSKGGLIGRPAALLMVEPHGAQTHAFLQVIHPISSNVNQASQSTWQGRNKKGGRRLRQGGERYQTRKDKKGRKAKSRLRIWKIFKRK